MQHSLPTTPPAKRTVLPARFRKERWLIVGCGDVGTRLARFIATRIRGYVLTSNPARLPILRQLGLKPLLGDLDNISDLRRLRALGQRLIYLAPPSRVGSSDVRSKNLIAVLRGQALRKVVYASTSGVYGDCSGNWVGESHPLKPQSARAQRRADAERRWRKAQPQTSVLRLPGIYNETRAQRLVQHFIQNVPTLCVAEDVYSNRVHASDAARACLLAAFRARARRSYHICEDTGAGGVLWSDFMGQAAQALGFAPPRRVTKAILSKYLSPARMAFLSESRRLQNQRMQRELGLYLPAKPLGLLRQSGD